MDEENLKHHFKTKKNILIFLIITILTLVSLIFNRLLLSNTSKDLKQISSERLIYNGIPSRIIIFKDENENERGNQQKIIDASWKEFDRIGMIVNPFSNSSEVAQLNNRYKKSSELISVSKDLAKLINYSIQINSTSNGAFDPTVWPIKNLWNKAREHDRPPSQQELDIVLKDVGMHLITLDLQNRLRFLRPNVKLDFGGIAKGYAVDLVRDLLQKNGVLDGLVQCGGETASWSKKFSSKEWKIAIQHPKNSNTLWGVIKRVGSIRASTSGNYRQPIKIQGKEYYHIFNPKTAKPVSDKILSVTLISFSDVVSNATIDALTKSILVLGEREGIKVIKKFKEIEWVIIIERDGSLIEFVSDGLKPYYTSLHI
ncbi:MAG: FAD:protein FMN transferase [Oligoflexia bacterium]|nr:FAD:protein FMN transferase [Oligoflexia bacterium]